MVKFTLVNWLTTKSHRNCAEQQAFTDHDYLWRLPMLQMLILIFGGVLICNFLFGGLRGRHQGETYNLSMKAIISFAVQDCLLPLPFLSH